MKKTISFLLFLVLSINSIAQNNINAKSNILKVNMTKRNTDNVAPVIKSVPGMEKGFKPTIINDTITLVVQVTDDIAMKEVFFDNKKVAEFSPNIYKSLVTIDTTKLQITIKAVDQNNNITVERIAFERKGFNKKQPALTKNGRYYALIIGNEDYESTDISKLTEPVKDAQRLYNCLLENYTFDKGNITLIKNGKYQDIIAAFDNISGKMTTNDNLLIFYAGHGHWDEKKNLGYWLPCDATIDNTAFWIRNSTISDYIASIPAKHILVIADACFSGSIFRTRKAFNDANAAINKLYEMPSRKAMTSGNMKTVPDKSMFIEYLIKNLNSNEDKYLSADQLFNSFRIAVLNNSSTEPQYGTIQKAGDEGGEFIFIRRTE